ncbi:MAG TPA: type IV secretion system DNA-binding domain-containing protein [Thermoanaerobaculia bacterium]|nr:type IV secretion system DNA-binding domain-containing protein [Thermoanaerobaculia bacterium]
MSHSPDDITYFARTNHRGRTERFGIRRADRRSHMYVIGRSGTGKSTLLKTLILQDLARGEGLALLDPHGDLVEEVARAVPEERRGSLVYLNAPDPGQPVRFNPLAGVEPSRRPAAAAGLVEVFKKIWWDSWGPRLEHLLRNVLFALLDAPGATFADIPRLLRDKDFRERVGERTGNSAVRAFWLSEYESYSPSFRALVTAPLQNKVGAFLTDPLLYRILVAPQSSFSLRELMDQGGILLVNLSKGRMGEGPAALLGALLTASLGLAGLSRADTPEERRRDFYIYLDEFHTFATPSLASILPELRKYRVSLSLAHQHLAQLDAQVRGAILGNVGTLVAFRVGVVDARLLAREFAPVFSAEDLVNLPNHEICLKLMVDGAVSRGFSAATFPLNRLAS